MKTNPASSMNKDGRMEALLIDVDDQRRDQLGRALKEKGVDVLALANVPESPTETTSSKDLLLIHTGDRQTGWSTFVGRWIAKPAILFGGTPPTYNPIPRPENLILINANILSASDFLGLGDLIEELHIQIGRPAYDWDELRRAANGEGGRRKRVLELLSKFLPLDIRLQIPDLEASRNEASALLSGIPEINKILSRILHKQVDLDMVDDASDDILRLLSELLELVRKISAATDSETLQKLFGVSNVAEPAQAEPNGYHRRFINLRDVALKLTEAT
ncbi:MAG: hypothetical protein MN733_05960 [Nitrososphaera sp.]|nr:hypothetical protein [Nitrososphaera sp.]